MDELSLDLQKTKSHSLSDVAPELLSDLIQSVPIPGVKGKEKLKSINGSVDIILTKNRPKKIHLISNLGVAYTYLIKGGEDDLHLDQRILQFLKISNDLLSAHLKSPYDMKSYYILPLGVKSGLIQWIQNCPSLYHICLLDTERNLNPHRTYAKKMSELGIDLQTRNRLDIPKETLIKALDQLEEEFDVNHVVHKAFISLESYSYVKQRQFCETTAISSIVGHILGLGDRHLQNILIDKTTCGIIHIDFAISFEKGRRLKVPEVVPFRLTKVIEDGLSPYCDPKSFAYLCSQSLQVIRSSSRYLFDIFQFPFKLQPIYEWNNYKSLSIAKISQEASVQLQLLKIQLGILHHYFKYIALKKGHLSDIIFDIQKIISNRKAKLQTGNVWNLNTSGKEQKESTIDEFNGRFLCEFELIFKICETLVQCPLAKFFTDNIASLLKALENLQNGLKHQSSDYLKELETYLSSLKDIKSKLDALGQLASKDVSGAANERNTHIYTISMNEEDRDYNDDYNDHSKNQEVGEYNVADDSLTFCNRVIDRFESRLFGHVEKSVSLEVDELILKSRSRERLAFMYEGWMPWI